VLQVALVYDLLDVNEVFANEDDVVEVLVSDARMEDEFDHGRADNGFGQYARPGGGGGGRLDRPHHENMFFRLKVVFPSAVSVCRVGGITARRDGVLGGGIALYHANWTLWSWTRCCAIIPAGTFLQSR
jgi:hypothetical protein